MYFFKQLILSFKTYFKNNKCIIVKVKSIKVASLNDFKYLTCIFAHYIDNTIKMSNIHNSINNNNSKFFMFFTIN